MAKIIRIESCDECPFCLCHIVTNEYTCSHKRRIYPLGQPIYKISIIQDWCPLPGEEQDHD